MYILYFIIQCIRYTIIDWQIIYDHVFNYLISLTKKANVCSNVYIKRIFFLEKGIYHGYAIWRKSKV